MIDLNIIDREILDLEAKDTSYAVIERLAWLYTVRDNMKKTALTDSIAGGEFCEACSNVPVSSLVHVIQEHMETIKLVYPKEYDAILAKIRSL